MTTTYMFKPKFFGSRYIMRVRRLGVKTVNYNFVSRDIWIKASWKFNHIILGKIFGNLHYFASHAPLPLQRKWKNKEKNFYKKHFGWKCSVRYANTWTCHSWL